MSEMIERLIKLLKQFDDIYHFEEIPTLIKKLESGENLVFVLSELTLLLGYASMFYANLSNKYSYMRFTGHNFEVRKKSKLSTSVPNVKTSTVFMCTAIAVGILHHIVNNEKQMPRKVKEWSMAMFGKIDKCMEMAENDIYFDVNESAMKRNKCVKLK